MERAYDPDVVREFHVEEEPDTSAKPPASRPVKVLEAEGQREVNTLRLGHGHRLSVESTRSQFEFHGGSFYMASRALSERLPYLGLTGLQYDVWHTLLGVQHKGGIIAMTYQQIADRLQTDKKNISRAIALFRSLGLVYQPRRGTIRLNPLIAFYGSSEQQQDALAEVPEDVPAITLPDGRARPRSRKPRTGPKGVAT